MFPGFPYLSNAFFILREHPARARSVSTLEANIIALGTNTRSMRTTKPVTFPLQASATCTLKVAKLVQGQGENINVYSSSCAHPAFLLDPVANGPGNVVLCQFAVRAVISEYPILRLRLSQNVPMVMERLVASSPNPKFQYLGYPRISW